jgi:hypothetical protein
MRRPILIAIIVFILAIVAGLVVRLPIRHDLTGAAIVEITAVKKTGTLEFGRDRVTRKIEITAPDDLKELNRLCQIVSSHALYELSAHEGWSEFYTLRFVRNGKEEQFGFSEIEWSPGGRIPPELLEWVRKKTNP